MRWVDDDDGWREREGLKMKRYHVDELCLVIKGGAPAKRWVATSNLGLGARKNGID